MFGRRALFTLVAGIGALAVAPASASPRVTAVRVGRNPGLVAIDSASGSIYVGNGDRSISVIGGATVTVGGQPTDLAIDESNGLVYAASSDAGTVTVLDADGRLRSVVAGGAGAAVLDLDPSANRLYVGSDTSGSLAVIDTVAGGLIQLVHGPGQGFGGAKVDAQRKFAYLSSVYTDTVEVFDLTSSEFVASISVGQSPMGLALHEASNTLYVANSAIHHLSVVDGASRAQRATILLRSEASSVAVHQASHTVYANGGPDGIVKIDGAAGKIVDQLSLGINPGGIAVDQRTGAVCVTDPLHDQLYVISGF
jgi:DNA-binding beta-propeller fold protein YncE